MVSDQKQSAKKNELESLANSSKTLSSAIAQKTSDRFEFLKATAIGGVFFLLPLIIIGSFLVKMGQFCIVAAKSLEAIFPIQAIGGQVLLFVAGLVTVVAACFIAGLIAQWSVAKRFTERIEKQLQIAFPRYTLVKDRLSGNIGGDHFRTDLKTVLVHGHDGCYRMGVEVERTSDEWATIYFPGSPDPWTGQVAIVPNSQLQPLEVDFTAAMSTLEKLGRQFQSTTKANSLLKH